jgi:membrane dipeptidase
MAHDFRAAALAAHKKFPCFDGHNDLPWALHEAFENKLGAVDLSKDLRETEFTGLRHGSLHTDMVRLREGGAGAQYWSVYVPTSYKGADAVQTTLEQIDLVHRLCDKYPKTLEFAWSAADVKRIFSAGRIASLCGVEGGHQINNSLGTLRMFHRLGVRYMTLTHNGGPGWAEPAVGFTGNFIDDEPMEPRMGLTAFGCEVVREMNRVGMLVDLAHVHGDTMRRALEITEAPIIVSHSNARALCAHPRNVPDDVLRLIRDNGGVVMVNFKQGFTAGALWHKGGKKGADLQDVADHVMHIREVAGIDHIGIGADFDGIIDPAVGLVSRPNE